MLLPKNQLSYGELGVSESATSSLYSIFSLEFPMEQNYLRAIISLMCIFNCDSIHLL